MNLEQRRRDLTMMVETQENFVGHQISDDINSLCDTLAEGCALLSLNGKILEDSSIIYQTAQKVALDDYISKGLDYKQDIFRRWIEGKTIEELALYRRAERSYKALEKWIDGVRTIISAEKSLAQQIQH